MVSGKFKYQGPKHTVIEREPYLDNVRIVFCMIIILFHCIRAYADWWSFILENNETSYCLSVYIVFSNAVSMSFFFLLSGYFTEPTYNNRSFKEFQNYRIKRFLPPIVVYAAVIISYYVLSRRDGEYFVVLGHLWFLEHILIYGFIYGIIRRRGELKALKKSKNEVETISETVDNQEIENSKKKEKPYPKLIYIILFILFLSGVTYIARIRFRISQWSLILYFFQAEIAHLPHYLAFFIIGIIAFRNRWFSKIPKIHAFFATISSVICMIVAVFVHLYVPLYAEDLQTGLTIESFLFSLWETVLAVSVMISVLYFFRKYVNKESRFSKKLALSTYDVYIAHVPISGLFQLILQDVSLSIGVKLLIVIPLTIVCSFGLSFLIRIKRNRKL